MEDSTWKPHTPALVQEELSDILANNPIVVFHFWAVWDYHDRNLDRILQEVPSEFDNNILIFSVDVDDEANHDLCRRINLQNIPALVCFLHGSWHETSIGARTVEQQQEKLRSWRSSAQIR